MWNLKYGINELIYRIEIEYNTAIPVLGIYPEKIMTQKDTYTLMFIVALYTIAKTWK